MGIPATLYTKGGGTNLAYQIFGSGPPVILIPPLISNVELGWEQELYRRVLDYFGRPAFIQNLWRGHYELGVDALPGLTLAAAFGELALVV
jgi:hypothetical protein